MNFKTMARVVAGLMAAVPLVVAAAESITVNIPSGDLAAALESFAKQSGIELVFRADQVQGVKTAGITGTLPPATVVEKLLEGTKFQLQTDVTTGAMIITQAPTASMDAARSNHSLRLATSNASSEQSGKSAEGKNGSPSQREGRYENKAGIEEITVTAQKREERLIDVPQSVTVLSVDDLSKQGMVQFRDYANRIPGLSYYSLGAGYTQISLRGVTVGQDISPTVGVYLDDVPYGSSTAFAGGAWTAIDVGLFNLERIEVLRGPQGTLYGASTIGGLIKYGTRRPDTASFSTQAQAGVSSTLDGGASYDISAAMNVPIAPGKAAVTFSAFESHDGGYVDNPTLGERNVNASDIYGGRVDLLYAPTEELSVRIAGFAQDTERDGMSQVDYGFVGQPLYGELTQHRLISEPFENRFRLVSGAVNYELGPATLTSISSYQTTQPRIEADGSGVYIASLQRLGRSYGAVAVDALYKTDKFAQELRLASNTSRRLDWLVGGFYTRENSEVATVLRAYDGAEQPRPDDEVLSSVLPSRYEEYSAFGNVTWHLTDKFDVTGGLRFARYDQQFSQTGIGLLGASTPFRQTQDEVLTYLANARYRFTDRQTVYLRYATGYRPGGINFVRIDPNTGLPVAPEAYDSDQLSSYEIGFKRDSADGRYAVELAGYWIDWDDIQLSGRRNGVALRTNSLGGATIKGAEFALSARPARALELSAALNYQDASLNEADPDLQAAKGERLPNSPDFTASLNADYTFTQSRPRPVVGASYRYVSERTSGYDAGTGSRFQYRLPNYSMVDLRAGLMFQAMDLQLYVRNVLDERAQLSAYTTYGSPLVTIAQPRTIGITATMHF